MERRYQVFVSSTFLDLKEERAAVVSALLNLDAFPAGMELFPAADDDAWTLIQRVIDSSDYYLLVIGGKYGSVDQETELSFTEKEFDYAVAQKKPVMAFIHDDPDGLPVRNAETDPKRRAKLDAFRDKVKSQKHVKLWNGGADALAGKVAMTFSSFTKTYPAVGWVRGDVQTATESIAENNALRKRLEEAEAKLVAARTQAPPGTEGFSQGVDTCPIKAVATVNVGLTNGSRRTLRFWYSLDDSWDDLFSALGPDLLDEGEQGALTKTLNAYLDLRHQSDALKQAEEYLAEGQAVDPKEWQSSDVEMRANEFGTLLVQLRALGLIEKSDRRRGVNDRGTYWTLTPFGDTHLTALRAITREQAEATSEAADETVQDDEE